MSLDHDTGRMDGEVIAGTFSGRRIGELGLEELLALVAECERADPSSVSILESYLDREHGDAWREARRGGGEGRPSGGTAEMTVDEALEVLGLEAGASHDDIVAAHRRLMQKLHPDRGGSGFLAAQINRAKDLLLAQS